MRLGFLAALGHSLISLSLATNVLAANGPPLKIDTELPSGFLDPPYQKLSYVRLHKSKADVLENVFGVGRPDSTLLPGEVYTFMVVRNHFHDTNVLERCSGDLFESSFISTNISIEYRGVDGSTAVNFVPAGALFIQGTNADDSGKRVEGCTFKSVSDQIGPYLLYTGFLPGQGEYTLHFNATRGKQTSSSLATIAALALSAAAVWPGFVPIAAPVAALTNTFATDLDKLFTGTSVVTVQYMARLTAVRKASDDERKNAELGNSGVGYYLAISSPRLNSVSKSHDGGFLEVYEGRSASIAVDGSYGDHISAEDILNNLSLGAAHNCLPGVDTCGKSSGFLKALGADFDDVGDFKDKATWIKLFSTCSKIRQKASELGLTSIDALLVRWAVLAKANLLGFIRQHQSGGQSSYSEILKQVQSLSMPDSSKLCWDTGDQARLDAIGKVMGIPFVEK